MKKYHHCVKFTYPLSFQTRIPKVDQHTGGKWTYSCSIDCKLAEKYKFVDLWEGYMICLDYMHDGPEIMF